ncbi:hypothetical protein LTR12_004833 [Friedmanniomyces endolithicus]|nr:hypothetical protein LTR12_004833 [Friedmanniomyces endolithicus]
MDNSSNFVGYDPYAGIAPVMGEQPIRQSDDEFAGLMALLDEQPGLSFGMRDGRQDALDQTTRGDTGAPRLPMANFRAIPTSPSSSPDHFRHSFEPTYGLDPGLYESSMSTIPAVPASDFGASNGLQDPLMLTTGGDVGLPWPREVDVSATQWAPMRSHDGLSSQLAPSASLGKALQSQFAPQYGFGDAVELAPERQKAAVSAASNALMLPQGHFLPFNSFAHTNEQALSGQSPATLSAAPNAFVPPQSQFAATPSPRKKADKLAGEKDGKKASRKSSAKEEDPAAGPSGEKQKRKSNNPAGPHRGLKRAKYIHMNRCREQGRCLAECRLASDFPEFYARSLQEWVPGR